MAESSWALSGVLTMTSREDTTRRARFVRRFRAKLEELWKKSRCLDVDARRWARGVFPPPVRVPIKPREQPSHLMAEYRKAHPGVNEIFVVGRQ